MVGFWIVMVVAALVELLLIITIGIIFPQRRIRKKWILWWEEVKFHQALVGLKEAWEGSWYEHDHEPALVPAAIRFRRPHRAAKRRRWRRRKRRNRRRLYWIFSHPASRRGFKAIQLSSAELEALREAKII